MKRKVKKSLSLRRERPRLVFLFFVVITVAFVIPIWLNYQASLGKKTLGSAAQEATYYFVTTYYKLVTVNELVDAFGPDLLLPTKMPDGLVLRKIHLNIWNDTTQAILSYSDREIVDYREGRLTLQLKKPATTGLDPSDPRIVDIGGLRISTIDRVLFFYQGSTYYLITGEYPKEVLIEVAKNMRAMKS